MTPLPDAHPHDRDAAADENGGDARDPDTHLAILLLEDEDDQAEILRDSLQFAGYTCQIARNKDLARAELARTDQHYAIMIADLNLANSNDVAFVREARGMPGYTALPVIITSGHDSREAQEQARLLGRSDYLTKPFSTKALFQLIKRWAEEKP